MNRFRTTAACAVALVAVLMLSACGNDDSAGSVPQSGDRPETTAAGGDGGGGESFPVTVAADNGDVTIDARPARIVSLSPTATEMLFAIDAGDQVVAVDEYSYYPDAAPVTDLSSYQPNVEAIAEHDPDLVIVSYAPDDVIDSLASIGIPTLYLNAADTFDDIYRQIEVLGAATGNIGSAAMLVAQMQSDIDEIIAGLPDHAEGLTYFHELDDEYYSITSSTFIGQVYSLMGLVNIADAVDPDGASFGYPKLSEEYIIESDPDIIFLADAACCGQNAGTVAARPGWGGLRAVTNGGVIEVDEDIASRWGPRIVDYLRSAAEAIDTLEPVS